MNMFDARGMDAERRNGAPTTAQRMADGKFWSQDFGKRCSTHNSLNSLNALFPFKKKIFIKNKKKFESV